MDTATHTPAPEPQQGGDASRIAPPAWKRRALILAVFGLLAGGVVVAASFMPWLSAERGKVFALADGSIQQTVSGWDLYENERDAGEDGLVAHGPLARSSGGPARFFTGLATVISGLWLAAASIVFVAAGALHPRFRQRRSLTVVFLVSVMALLFLTAAVVGVPSIGVVFAYFQQGEPRPMSLEYGAILLCAAAFVGLIGAFSSIGLRTQEVLLRKEQLRAGPPRLAA